MTRFHVATYNEREKKFVIVAGYDDVNEIVKDFGREVLARGKGRVILLEQLDVDIDVRVKVLRKDCK